MPFDLSPITSVWLLWAGAVAVILAAYRRDIHRIWREPVFRRPVLVVESDDWGAGPVDQAAVLDELAALLGRFHDASGRTPVMSLAVVLAVPDGSAIASHGGTYARICLDQPPLAPVLQALKRGEGAGVFSLQLHGMEHFWPPTLMASEDPQVQAWLRSPSLASTELLAPHLQSRWVDASRLPTLALPEVDIAKAVADEVAAYARVTGRRPALVVPPTFVWTLAVERAWAANGVTCVITPGQRYVSLASDGASTADSVRFANGDQAAGITYLVRCDYFEPARGRDAAYALRAFERACDDGRPCVLENHRVNFCRDAAVRNSSLAELAKLLAGALALRPGVRFLASADLFDIVKRRDPDWISQRFGERLPYVLQRLSRTGRLWKLLLLVLAGMPMLLLMASRPRALEHARG